MHDPILVERMAALKSEPFDGLVHRATRENLDPRIPSTSGGRWAPRSTDRVQVPVLYTSLVREGALAEVCYHWSSFTPRPSKPVKITKLEIKLKRVVTVSTDWLTSLGIDMTSFGDFLPARLQEVGAVAAFLGFDGLKVPSARWKCENLVIFTENHDGDEPKIVSSETVAWQEWAKEKGILLNE